MFETIETWLNGLVPWQPFISHDCTVIFSFFGARIVILDRSEVPDYIQLCGNERRLGMKGPGAQYLWLLWLQAAWTFPILWSSSHTNVISSNLTTAKLPESSHVASTFWNVPSPVVLAAVAHYTLLVSYCIMCILIRPPHVIKPAHSTECHRYGNTHQKNTFVRPSDLALNKP